ncbi:hypothetical protein HanRHA438_Chr08g0358211 [Helianthus annuus]|nr:hypothetical protein HanRHA438_Chr08g0358211 [Helianthus annuus]
MYRLNHLHVCRLCIISHTRIQEKKNRVKCTDSPCGLVKFHPYYTRAPCGLTVCYSDSPWSGWGYFSSLSPCEITKLPLLLLKYKK